jgi:hypothetical protein
VLICTRSTGGGLFQVTGMIDRSIGSRGGGKGTMMLSPHPTRTSHLVSLPRHRHAPIEGSTGISAHDSCIRLRRFLALGKSIAVPGGPGAIAIARAVLRVAFDDAVWRRSDANVPTVRTTGDDRDDA